MTIDRVGTSGQSQVLLAQIQAAEVALNKTQDQVSSGKVASDYGGLGDKVSVLEAARSASSRADATATATNLALNQADLQNTQITSLAGLADQLRQALTDAVANGDGSTLSSTAQSIFDQAKQILNAQDSSGNYIYGGQNGSNPPVTAASLSDLVSMPSVASAFANGDIAKSVNVGQGQSVQVGQLASNLGTQLFQTLKDIGAYTAANGDFGSDLTSDQSDFISGEIGAAKSAATGLNTANAANGNVYNQLQDAVTNQQSLSTLYTGFVSNLEDVDMGTAITQLNQNQVALQAALGVTASLNQISLLNYLSPSTTTG